MYDLGGASCELLRSMAMKRNFATSLIDCSLSILNPFDQKILMESPYFSQMAVDK
jgi:hypothetical protein